jgi:hypothetical protein
LETDFSRFAKIRWMPSWFAKLLELLSIDSYVYKVPFPFFLDVNSLYALRPYTNKLRKNMSTHAKS